MPRLLETQERNPVSIFQEAEWAPGPVWTGGETLAPNGTRSPYRPPLASRYTYYSVPPTNILLLLLFTCSLVDTQWQQYSTHLHTNSTQNTENGTYITITNKKQLQGKKLGSK
jgi:hypothetical protein